MGEFPMMAIALIAGHALADYPSKAIRYARREDAEAVHYYDEDAWTVQPATAVIAAMKGEAGNG